MSILGPLAAATTSTVTLALARAAASVVTVSPSTRSSTGSCSVVPRSLASRSTWTRSSTATFSWRPPARTIAYTAGLLASAARDTGTRERVHARSARYATAQSTGRLQEGQTSQGHQPWVTQRGSDLFPEGPGAGGPPGRR